MLSFPLKMDLTLSTSFSLSVGDETSQTEPVTLRCMAPHRCRHFSSSASFRAQVCTAAPNLANSSTMACLRAHAATQTHFFVARIKSKGEKKLLTQMMVVAETIGRQQQGQYPIPLVPAVTKAAAPLRDHLSLSSSIVLSSAATRNTSRSHHL